MTLDQVGSEAGPDFEQLRLIQKESPNTSIYAAGGVRSTADLMALRQQNTTGALVASALHAAAISGKELQKLQQVICQLFQKAQN